MLRRAIAAIAVMAVAAACQGTAPTSPSTGPSATSTADGATAPRATTAPTPMPSLAAAPAGRILFHRKGLDGVERYFTIKTDGTDEHPIFEAEGCGCAIWSFDGTQVLTLDETGHGTWSFTTYRFDGTAHTVLDNPVATLNMVPKATTRNGRSIAFAAWDEAKPSNSGIWLAAPDLADLHQVMPLQEGMLAAEPYGISPDELRIVVFAETGPEGGTTHAGDLYVVGSDGTGLRKLNPPGPRPGFIGVPPISLSPDGGSAAFAAGDTVYVVDLKSGAVRPITHGSGYAWAVAWSPAGAWITYTRQHGATSVVSLVRPDGTEDHEISPDDPANEAAVGVWSPDGKYLLVSRDQVPGPDSPQDLWIMDLDGTTSAR
jgi:hypothetical protein